jgi:hypothetical protein
MRSPCCLTATVNIFNQLIYFSDIQKGGYTGEGVLHAVLFTQ